MTAQDLILENIATLAPLIQHKEISPVALTEAYLARIEKLNSRFNAYITILAETAMAEARKAETEIMRGEYRGKLHGIPMGIKDQFLTKGIRTTFGSTIFGDQIPSEDATVVSRLKAAGIIMLGKHNLAEFALGGTRKHPYGTPRNPWDPERIPGHTSSGSGVAVAASMCTAAIGEDTGGSGRIPAAMCGIVAIRPTYGRVTRYGAAPASWSMDAASPMTKSVEDCAIVLGIIAGYDPKDPLSNKTPVPNYTKNLKEGIRGIKIGVIKELIPPNWAHSDIRDAFERNIKIFEKLGASVSQVSIPLINLTAPIFVAICDTDAAYVHYDNIRNRTMDYDEASRTRLMSASLVSAGIYTMAQQARNVFRNQMLASLKEVDVLLSPMSYTLPIKISDEVVAFETKEDVISRQYGARSFTTPYSLSCLPAISIPSGFTNEGMPIGLQIGGRQFDEETVFKVAYAFETETEWHRQRPSI